MTSKLGMTITLCMAYYMPRLILVSMTLTLIQVVWVSKGKNSVLNYFDNYKQATNIKTCYNGRPFYLTLTLQTFIWLDHLVSM